jgi:hypothetical protein
MKKQTQIQRIISKLNRDKYITRNECLAQKPCISRLGAYIVSLRKMGWDFEVEDTGKDYIYRVKKSIYQTVQYTLPDGKIITTYQ